MAGKGNIDNLRTPTSEEARMIGRKGGFASGISRNRVKTFSQCVTDFADGKLDLSKLSPELKEKAKAYGFNFDDPTGAEVIALRLCSKAAEGYPEFIKMFLLAIGENGSVPNESVTVNITVEGAEGVAGNQG